MPRAGRRGHADPAPRAGRCTHAEVCCGYNRWMPVSLTPRERAHLKARAHALEPKVHGRPQRADTRGDRRNRPRADSARVDQGEDPGRRSRGPRDDGERDLRRDRLGDRSACGQDHRTVAAKTRGGEMKRGLLSLRGDRRGPGDTGDRGRSDDASGRPDRQGEHHRQGGCRTPTSFPTATSVSSPTSGSSSGLAPRS